MPKALLILLVTICAALMPERARAQEFLWEIDFDSRFDNREYGSPIAADGTIFGARLSPQVGLGWGRGNSIMGGVDLRVDFGQGEFSEPEGVLYYNYNMNGYRAFAGVFPRKNMMGDYINAFFSDSMRFYDNNIEGVLLQYGGRRGYLEFGCDWNSKVSGDRHEKFMIFTAGHIRFGSFHMGFAQNMYHHAGSETVRGVVDNILLYPYVGAEIGRSVNLTTLLLRVGWVQSFQNDRRYVDRYVSPGGVQIDLRAEKWGVGIANSLYLGDNLMPYYTATVAGQPSYGDGLYYGDPFYRTDSGVYNRLEIYWHPVSNDNIDLHVGSVFHFDGSRVGWQQVLSLRVSLFDGMFD